MTVVLQGMLLLILGLSVWAVALPVRRGVLGLALSDRVQLLGISLLGVATRIWLSPRAMAPVPDTLAMRLVLTSQEQTPHPIYGGGMQVIGLAWKAITAGEVTGWINFQLAMSCLAIPLVWYLARSCVAEHQRSAAGLCAGVLAALLPAHVMLSAGVLEHVSLTTLCLATVAASVGSVRQSSGALGLLAGLIAGFAGHVRPEVLPFCGLMSVWLIASRGNGRWWRRLGAATCMVLMFFRYDSLPSNSREIAERVLLNNIDDVFGGTSLYLLVPNSWDAPSSFPIILNTFAEPWLTPYLAWPISLLGLAYLLLRRNWVMPVAWLALFLPICLRGQPISDAARFQLPAMLVACIFFGAGGALLTARFKVLLVALLAGTVALSVPLLERASETWLVSSTLAVMKRGAEQRPATAWTVVPRFNSYANAEASLVASLSEPPSSKYQAVAAGTSLPDGEKWLWWPVQCTPVINKRGSMKSVDFEACTRFEQCSLEAVVEDHLFGRVERSWTVPPDGIRVGWYKIVSCP